MECVHLVVWSDVGEVKVRVHRQADTQPPSLPGHSCHLLPRNLQGSQMLFEHHEEEFSAQKKITDLIFPRNEIFTPHLSERCVELHDVELFLQI